MINMGKVTKSLLEKIANSVKVSQGSCKESSLEILNALMNRGIAAQILSLPRQNHVVVGLGGYIIDPAIEVDYKAGEGKRIFKRKKHKKIMQEIASKEPFCFYMDKNIVYEPVRLSE